MEQSEKKLIMDIKKSAKDGQMVRIATLLCDGPESHATYRHSCQLTIASGFTIYRTIEHQLIVIGWYLTITERVQDNGEGPRADAAICAEVLPDADAAAGSRTANTDIEE